MVLTRKPKKRPWFEFSKAQYYLKVGTAINMFSCAGYSGGIDERIYSGTDRHGKLEIVAYADASGIEPCPGVTWESVIDDTASIVQISAGFNVARELALMRKGFVVMVYAAGTAFPFYGMKIAPHPNGFQEWKPGMFELGIFGDEVISTGVDFALDTALRTFDVGINVMSTSDASRVEEQLTVSTNTATLSGAPEYFDLAIATAETATDYHVKILDINGIIGTVGAGEYIFYQERRETCQAGGTTTTAVLDSAANGVDDYYNGMTIEIYDPATGASETRLITDYDQATKTVTVTPALTFSPDTADNFHIIDPGEDYTIEFNATDAVTAARVVYRG